MRRLRPGLEGWRPVSLATFAPGVLKLRWSRKKPVYRFTSPPEMFLTDHGNPSVNIADDVPRSMKQPLLRRHRETITSIIKIGSRILPRQERRGNGSTGRRILG
jgi:hypothetical protein